MWACKIYWVWVDRLHPPPPRGGMPVHGVSYPALLDPDLWPYPLQGNRTMAVAYAESSDNGAFPAEEPYPALTLLAITGQSPRLLGACLPCCHPHSGPRPKGLTATLKEG